LAADEFFFAGVLDRGGEVGYIFNSPVGEGGEIVKKNLLDNAGRML